MAWRTRTSILMVLAAGALLSARPSNSAPPPFALAETQVDEPLLALRFADAESLAAAALTDAERRDGPSSPAARAALDVYVLALAAGPRAATPETRNLARRAVGLHELHGDDAPGLARSRLRLARVFQRLAVLDSAEIVGEKAHAASLALDPPDPSLTGVIQARRADIEVAAGHLSRAVELATEGVSVLRGVGADVDSLDLAFAEGVLGKALLRTGQADSARVCLQNAFSIRERHQGAFHPDLVNHLQQIASYHAVRGDFRAGIALLERAVAIADNSLASDRALGGSLYSQLSNFHSRSGNYADAARFARLSAGARLMAFGREHSLTAQSLISLASALGHLGDLVEALESGEQAVDILRATVSPGSEELAYGLSTLATICLLRREPERAHALYSEAAEIREALYRPDHRSVLFVLAGMAEAQEKMGDLAGAVETLTRVSRLQETADPASSVPTLATLARVYRRQGRPTESLAVLDRVSLLADTLVGSATNKAREVGRLRVEVLYELGRRDEALSAALTLERSERETLRLTASRVAEREAGASLAIRAGALDVALAMAVDPTGLTPAELGQVWEELVKSRALLFEVLSERRRRLRDAAGPLVALSARVDTAQTVLARHLVRPRGATDPEWSAEADALRGRLEEAERALGERSAEDFSVHARESAGVVDILERLPPASALVSTVRHRRPSDPAGRSSTGYLALVYIADEKRMVAVPLGDAELLETLVRQWLAVAGRPPGRDDTDTARGDRDIVDAGQTLRRAFWDPLASHIAGVQRIYMVPDGFLHLLNPGALPTNDGRYLVEDGPLWTLLTTERDLLLGEPRRSGHRGLLVIGGPDFNGEAASESAGAGGLAALEEFRSVVPESDHLQFAPLAGAVSEGEDIARVWREREGSAAHLLTGAAATEAAFCAEAAGRRILHLATHGFRLGAGSDSTSDAAFAARGVGGLIPTDSSPPRPLPGAAPLAVYGLAMAGINRVAVEASGQEDGYLTGGEISALPLQDTEWAVLSACRTGVADMDQSESVQGLHRAFRLAGVRTVIMSLWPVQDEPTRAWMTELYRARLDGADTPGAVRAAHRAILAARRSRGESTHPFYWAPFIAIGSPE